MSRIFHPAAETEFLEAVGYYESCAQGLGRALIDEFEGLLEFVVDAPQAWPVEVAPDIRRAHLRRFPLALIYRYHSSDTFHQLQILAFAHDRRRPQYWLERAHDALP